MSRGTRRSLFFVLLIIVICGFLGAGAQRNGAGPGPTSWRRWRAPFLNGKGKAEGGPLRARLPERWSSPLAKSWYRSHERANLRRDPPGLVPLGTWASHPIVSRHGEPCRGTSSPLPPGT